MKIYIISFILLLIIGLICNYLKERKNKINDLKYKRYINIQSKEENRYCLKCKSPDVMFDYRPNNYITIKCMDCNYKRNIYFK